MLRINRHFVWSVFLILVVIINLMNVNVALADDSVPTPPPTEEPTEPPVEPTEPPVLVTETPSATEAPTQAPAVESTPTATDAPVAAEETPASAEQNPDGEEAEALDILQTLPENSDIIVLDENGNPVSLASQQAVDIILETDPMWCPVIAGVPTLPGGAGCTINFATGQALINDMDASNPGSSISSYEQDGIVYFTTNPGGSFALIPGGGSAIDTADYNALKGYNLTLQGGWNGSNGGAATFTGQTNFGNNTLTVGTNGNPWVGNVTLTNFSFSGVSSSNAVTVYTTSGDITLNNVDVAQQAGRNYTAALNSTSGDITVQNGSSFDGNNSGNNRNRGFSASTNSGSITISDTTFADARGCTPVFIFCVDALENFNGATLDAPTSTVTLTNVTSNNNDLNGIEINAATATLTNVTTNNNNLNGVLVNNANTVNLNNVTANNNGTLIFGSGVNVNGTGATLVNISGGTFNNNAAYGVSVFNGTLNVTTPMNSCTGNNLGCTNDAVPPVLSLPANMTLEATGPSGAVATFTATATDNVNGNLPVTCNPASGSTFPIATTTVNCSASDANGNTANGSFTVTVQDTTGPALNLPANMTLEATSPSGAVATFSPTANDIVDGARPVTCVPASGSTFPITTTTVNCAASDTRGNTTNGSFTVTVQDTTAPTLTVPADMTLEATGPSGAVATFTATATDIVDLTVTVVCAPPSGSTFPITTTTVTCTATDDYNNSTSDTFNVTVQDTTAPTLTLPANMTLEATGPSGAVATFSASASDIVDGSLPVTCVPPSGSTFPITTTTVNCSSTDTSGNTANGSFTVTVQDTTPPTLTLPANMMLEATGPSGAVATFSASASDIVDGSLPVTCVPPSGSTFPITTTTVNCSSTDTSGNTANGSFTVTVQDTTPPTLTLPANMTLEATGPSGAVATFSASASDIVDGALPVTCVPPSGSTFPITTTTVNCSSTDTNGNTANGSFTVTVQDTTPPVISPMADMLVHTLSELGAQAFYTSPSTSDIVDGAGVAVCSPVSGSLFAPGNTTVTCTASDSHGNTSSITFNVHINFNPPKPGLTGFGGAHILVTGGEVIDLACNMIVNAFGTTVKFHNLCDLQAVINEVSANALPSALPSGFTFVQGLDIQILAGGQALASLPKTSGVEIDFPLPDGSTYAVMYWNNGQWVEITQPMNAGDLFNILSKNAAVELYKMSSSNSSFQNVLTTDLTGIFVLVKK